MTNTLKLTSKRHHIHKDLRQVKSLVDIPHLNVSQGDLGGYVHKDSTPTGQCWVDEYSLVYSKHIHLEAATLIRTTANPDAQAIINNTTLTDSYVNGSNDIYLSQLKDVIVESSNIESADLTNCRIENSTILRSEIIFEFIASVENAIIRDGRITHRSQIHSVHPIGSEDSTASVYPGLDGIPTASVGCWTGLLAHLPEEVSDRIDPIEFSTESYERYHAQYKAFQLYAEALTKTWKGNTTS